MKASFSVGRVLFGRRVEFDERSRGFGAAGVVDSKPRSWTWACPTWLDQGAEGACTGFAFAHHRAARPKPAVTPPRAADAVGVYVAAKRLDSWPGEDYEGTSILAAAKAAKAAGWIAGYRWAFGEQQLAVAVSRVGPVVLGLHWHEGMSSPDARGFIRPTGRIAGGHAILCTGYNKTLNAYRLHNSWGKKWGRDGACFVSAADMSTMLANEGEACVPIKP